MFDNLFNSIAEWFKGILIEGIGTNMAGAFAMTGNVLDRYGSSGLMTLNGDGLGISSLIQTLSQNVILPIAGIILTFVMCYELIQIIIQKNNMHDIDTWIFFKWIFKTFIAVLLVTNTWQIVSAVFNLGNRLVQDAAGTISTTVGIDTASAVSRLMDTLQDKNVGELIGLYMSSGFVFLAINILVICVFLVIYARIIEIYLVTSLAPIPFATFTNHDWSHVGQNYLKSILALAFQGFLIMVCMGIYAVLLNNISFTDDLAATMWICVGYTALLVYALFKTGSVSKSIFSAH